MLGTISKALISFVAIVAGNLWTQVTTTGTPLPHNTSGWVALVVTSVGGSFLVWAKANNPFKSKSEPAS